MGYKDDLVLILVTRIKVNNFNSLLNPFKDHYIILLFRLIQKLFDSHRPPTSWCPRLYHQIDSDDLVAFIQDVLCHYQFYQGSDLSS